MIWFSKHQETPWVTTCHPIKYDSMISFPHSSVGKEPAYNAEDLGSISGSGRSPGEGNCNSLQYSCWRIPWTEEPGRLQSTGLQELDTTWQLNHHHNHQQAFSMLIIFLPCILKGYKYYKFISYTL